MGEGARMSVCVHKLCGVRFITFYFPAETTPDLIVAARREKERGLRGALFIFARVSSLASGVGYVHAPHLCIRFAG